MAKNATNNLTAAVRKETGKGASRRARRTGKVPTILYGHGAEPQHLELDAHDFSAVLRNSGTNAVLTLDIEGKEQLALTKSLEIHPIRRNIQHADLLVVRRGEKVTVEVNVVVEGEAAYGTLVTQDANTIDDRGRRAVDPRPPHRFGRGRRDRHPVRRGAITLPAGVTLVSDPEMLVVNVVAAPTAEDLESRGCRRGRPKRPRARARRPPRARARQPTRHPPKLPSRRTPRWPIPFWWSAWATLDRDTRRRGTTWVSLWPTSCPTASARGSRCTRSRGPRWRRATLGGRSIVLAKPRCYMNESGRQVGPLAKFYSVAPADIVVIHDELDIEFGRIRLKFGGGVAGHNGLRSVASALGTNDFQRVRIGIGRPPGPHGRRGVRAGELHHRRVERGSDDLRAGRRRDRTAGRAGP